jgi:hypothetical protein
MSNTFELVPSESEFSQDKIKKIDSSGQVWWIPLDPSNADYQEYLAQLENEGI